MQWSEAAEVGEVRWCGVGNSVVLVLCLTYGRLATTRAGSLRSSNDRSELAGCRYLTSEPMPGRYLGAVGLSAVAGGCTLCG